jgi:hypothetical protein
MRAVGWIGRRRVLGVAAAGLLVVAVNVAPAYAESAWWGLASGSRPAELRSGSAQDEVQSVRVSATGGVFSLEAPSSKRLVSVAYDVEAPVLQKALEEEVYGTGNVQVTGGPGSQRGSEPYVLTFTGELKDQAVGKVVADSGKLTGGEKSARVSEVTPGSYDAQIIVTALNLGNADANGTKIPVAIADTLPAGLKGVTIEGIAGETAGNGTGAVQCAVKSLTCTFSKTLPAYEQIEVRIGVVVEADASSAEINEVRISGGEPFANRTLRRHINVGSQSAFGIEDYELVPEEVGGGLATQAGSHPFQLTTVITLNQTEAGGGEPVALAKDVRPQWPAGLIGNPTPFAQCTDTEFSKVANGVNECPAQTAVGVVNVTVNEPVIGGVITFVVPFFNLKPAVGEPARFGFEVEGSPVAIDTSIRTGGDYGVTVSANNITQTAAFVSSKFIVWGVPGDPRHDGQRGWSCVDNGTWRLYGMPPCAAVNEQQPPPFLVLPTSCTGPLQSGVVADSWANAGSFQSFPTGEAMPAMDGCDRLPFGPEITVAPDVAEASAPTGLTVGIRLPQNAALNAKGLAESDLKDTTVVLPEGVAINPGGADGLEACSEAQVGFLSKEEGDAATNLFTDGLPEPFCRDASKIGTVEIETPLLPPGHALKGAVYLADQTANPFGSLIAMYIVAEDPISGSLVKLGGEVSLSETGQITSTFKNTPELAFETLRLHFFGGDRAPLGTPPLCGGYKTVASFTPWSGNEPVQSESEFQIKSGRNERPCPNNAGDRALSALPFAPSLTASTTSIQAGGYTPFTMTMSRADGNQNLQAVQLRMPPGLLGRVSAVKLCEESQASAGTCGQESLIGHTTVSVGLGGNPYSVTGGEVFLTGPYDGAPYGLSILNPAKAGPFDLGKVVVRARVEVDPTTAALTVTTDPSGPFAVPHILDGIPLQIQHINVTIDRSGFTFNPTDCEKMQITGSLRSDQGAVSALAVPFQVTNCAVLGFKPVFSVSTAGRTSRKSGASLRVKLSYPPGSFGSDANIAKVKVDLPKQLPSRLTTLQKACPDSTFDQDPAGCSAGSRVGIASASTPLLSGVLTGPAYFVSHGGAKFPELIIVLQGAGVSVYLHGETFISKTGITSSTFRQVPDVPIGTFELNLPQGANSALAANGNLCKSTLKMPTAFTAQNGLVIHQATPITPTGCPKHVRHERRKSHRKKK